MTELVTNRFVMHGARDALMDGLGHMDAHVKSIEKAVFENSGLAFDLAKTLIESVCRTILDERSVDHVESDDLPKLFRSVKQHLSFLPEKMSSEVEARKSLEKTLNGLNTAIHGICELRNQCGFASHGSGEPRPVLEAAQALLAAEAADTIVGFLHRMHQQDRTPSPKVALNDNKDFNNYLDESCGPVMIFNAEFKPSEILFEMEPESYRIYLAEFESGNAEASSPANEGM